MRPPPRVLVAVAAGVLAVTGVLAVLGALRTGVTTDEPIHVMRLRNFLDTGWYALDWDYTGAGPGGAGTNTYVYAPVTMLLLHAWSVLWGVEGWHDVAVTSRAYDVRHLGVVLIGMTGLASAAAVGRVVLHSWRWGVVAAAALAALPLWTGHEMFNVKDVPVATGHTVVTLGLLLHVRDDPPGRLVRGGRAVCVVTGLVLTLGTRPGMWPGLAVGLAIAALGVVVVSTGPRSTIAGLAGLAASCAAAVVVLVAIYPHLFGSPLRALPRTSETSSRFLSGEKSDRLYVPRHVLEDLPTLLTMFALVGTLIAVVSALRVPEGVDRVQTTRLALVGAQAFALPAAAIVLGSDLYHGLRQLLFALPALAVLAAYGMARCWTRSRGVDGVRWRRLVLGVAAAALVLPSVDQISLQPYQTTYVNFVTDLQAAGQPGDERPGGDYWRVSLPELVAGAPLDRQLLCKATVSEVTDLAQSYANSGEAFSTSRSTDCREEATGPLAPDRLPVVRRLPATEYDAVFIGPVPRNCTPLDEVRRWRHGFDVVISTMGRCRAVPARLALVGARADDPVLGTAVAGDLWLYAADGWLQWPGRTELTAPVPVAELAFRTDPACAPRCTLRIDGTAPDDVVARVGGTEVRVVRCASGLELRLPPALGEDPVWVTLSRRSGETLSFTMTGLSLTPRAWSRRQARSSSGEA